MNNIDQFNIEKDADSLVWAKSLRMGNAIFKDLMPGDRFSFHTSPEVFVKFANGYRAINGGKLWRTGQRTAVFFVPPSLPITQVDNSSDKIS